MSPPQPAMMAGVEGKLKLLQALVVNQWKTGGAAELRVVCESGHLKVSVSADFDLSSESWKADSDSLGGSPSRQRRRQRRAAARAAAEMAASEMKVTVAVPEKCEEAAAEMSEESAAENSMAEMTAAGKVETDQEDGAKSAAFVASEEEDAEKKSIVMENDSVASTSCNGKQLPQWKSCWNCEGEMSFGHQCDIQIGTAGMSNPAPASTAPCGPTSLAVPGVAVISPPRWKAPGPSAPVILNKPVKMLDGSPIWTPRTKK